MFTNIVGRLDGEKSVGRVYGRMLSNLNESERDEKAINERTESINDIRLKLLESVSRKDYKGASEILDELSKLDPK